MTLVENGQLGKNRIKKKQKISIVVLPGYILKADLNMQLGFQYSVVYPSTDSRNQNKYKR